MGQTGIKNTKTYQVEVVTLIQLQLHGHVYQSKGRVRNQTVELKGERLKRLRVKGERLRVKGERLWVRDNNRVASVLQNFNNL